MSDLTTPLLDWISLNPIWAGWVILLVAMLESLAIVGMLVPGAMMMIGFGALIANETLAFWPTVSWAIAGAIIGDGISFLIGSHFSSRISTLWPFVHHPQRLEQGVIFFQRHGTASIILGRFIGPIRAIIPLIAGMMGMSPQRFLVANILSAIIWAPLYLLPGIALGMAFDQASSATLHFVILGLILLALGYSLLWLLKQLMPINIARGLFALLLIVIVGSGSFFYWQPGYTLKQRSIALQQEEWWQQDWQQLPHSRDAPCQAAHTTFNIQFNGKQQSLREALEVRGWQVSERLNWMNMIKLFSPNLTLHQLPVITTRNSGNFETLIMQLALTDSHRLLLRLWPSQYTIKGETIWLGSLSKQHRLDLFGLLFLPLSEVTEPSQLAQTLPWLSQQQRQGKLILINAAPPL